MSDKSTFFPLVSEDLVIASYSRRFLAYLVDIIPYVALVVYISYTFFGFDGIWKHYISDRKNVDFRAEFIYYRDIQSFIALFFWCLVCIFYESSCSQGTWGKRLFKIKVVDYNGNRIDRVQAFKRNLAKCALIAGFFIGVIWIFFDKYNRALYDKFAATLVVRTRKIL